MQVSDTSHRHEGETLGGGERERGGAESTVTTALCLHYDPSGEPQRCADATRAHTPVPGEPLK